VADEIIIRATLKRNNAELGGVDREHPQASLEGGTDGEQIMTSQKPVRFGLLGAGLISPFHAKGIKASPGCELVAIADSNAQRVQARADEFGCRACLSLDELLADESIDVINILLPNHLHAAPTIAAARAGKHVLVEKPPALSLADTDSMIAACSQAGVQLGIVLNCRVRKPIQAIRQAIAEGRFGRLLQADAFMKWFRSNEYYASDDWRSNRRSGAGVTIQHAFHYIDLIRYLMGPASAVEAKMLNLTHPQVQLEDTLYAHIEFANGARGLVEASTAFWPGSDMRIEINGENGSAVMVGERMDTWKFRDEKPEDETIRQLGRNAVGTAADGPANFDFADHKVIIEGMAEAVRNGKEPLVTASDARGTLELALAMYKSARVGQAVQLPLTDEESVWD
jgi:UDP-N-acetyl-2-amino-2-deoxyglucuronate dehydrogenase